MPNTNCLEGWKCPKCGHTEDFSVEVSTVARLFDNGFDDHGEMNYEPNSWVICGNYDCEHEGTVKEFCHEDDEAPSERDDIWRNRNEYDIYLACANDGKGGDITRNGAPLKTFEEWSTS